MIDAHRIVYRGLDSLDFDLTPHLSFGSENGATSSFLNREAISTEVYDGSRKRIHGSKYTDSATPRFTLIKQNFQDFTPEENRRVLSWLTSSDKPSWLDIYQDDSNVVSYRYFCIPTTIEQYKLSNGRVVGYEFEIFSDAPYAWSRKFTYPEVHENLTEVGTNDETNDYLAISEPTTFTVTCTSDEYNKVLFPKVTIVFGSENVYVPIDQDPTADLYEMMPNVIYLYNSNYYVNINGQKYTLTGIFSTDITNQQSSATTLNKYYYFSGNKAIYKGVAPNNVYGWELVGYVGSGVQIENSYTLNGETKYSKSILVGGTPNETVVLDGTNKVISSTITPFRIIGDDFNWEWVPIAEGENNIAITGNCKIKFEWIEPRKVGSL